jgi:isocitrate lyase
MTKMERMQDARELAANWEKDEHWRGIIRPYKAEDVVRLRGTLPIRYTLAEVGAAKLMHLIRTRPFVPALGAQTGNQAVQMVQAGLPAIYVSGWQVAADNNESDETYPDQSLYPSDSVPHLIRRINNAFKRQDERKHALGGEDIDWFVPIVADAEAGFGGPLNAFELMKDMIEAGVAGVHLEDQLSNAKKCGHLGGKVLVPAREFIWKLAAARLAADVMDVPTLLIARTDALSAKTVTNDVDPVDRPFISGKRTFEGYWEYKGGIEAAIARGLAYAPHSDMVWFETASPDPDEARTFAEAIHSRYPGKALAYNCSPSFHWRGKLSEDRIVRFQSDLGEMGYRFQFVTLAGFHSLNYHVFELARDYLAHGMSGYARFQEQEFASVTRGYKAVAHQSFVGTDYFDEVANVISGGESSTLAMEGSTEREQFRHAKTSGRAPPAPPAPKVTMKTRAAH